MGETVHYILIIFRKEFLSIVIDMLNNIPTTEKHTTNMSNNLHKSIYMKCIVYISSNDLKFFGEKSVVHGSHRDFHKFYSLYQPPVSHLFTVVTV